MNIVWTSEGPFQMEIQVYDALVCALHLLALRTSQNLYEKSQLSLCPARVDICCSAFVLFSGYF